MEKYIVSLTASDLSARHVSSHREYYDIVKRNCVNCSIDLSDIIFKANEYLVSNTHFNYSKFQNYPWKIICTLNNVIENGYPFTVDDIIYLPIEELNNRNKDSFLKLLIHERIHIFQRFYPDDVNMYILNNGYILYRKIDRTNTDHLLRSNPDLNEYIYLLNGKPSGNYYTSYYPLNIEDSVCQLQYEHPYEHMAYVVSSDIITSKKN